MITREELIRAKIFPIIAEEYVKDSLNVNFPEVEVLGSKYGAGDILEAIDPIKFGLIVDEEISQHLSENVWVEIDDFYYSTYEVNCYLGLDE